MHPAAQIGLPLAHRVAQHLRRPSRVAFRGQPPPRLLSPAADRSDPHVSSSPTFLRATRKPPARAPGQPPPAPGLLTSWERLSPRLASLNQSPHPSRPLLPLPTPFSPSPTPRRSQPLHGGAPPTVVCPSARTTVPKPPSASFFPL
ncbi:extensin-like [Miscanthus floridulus]|uniref:extensin-like n=1 Tax=Miscanthus floridulus TaxID=154761 RepID=UPI00345A48E7